MSHRLGRDAITEMEYALEEKEKIRLPTRALNYLHFALKRAMYIERVCVRSESRFFIRVVEVNTGENVFTVLIN